MRATQVDESDRVLITEAAASLADAFSGDVEVIETNAYVDTRGRLTEFDPAAFGFPVARIFTVTDVPAGTVRGGHAHRSGVQALFCTAGRIDVELRRGDATHPIVTVTGGGPGLAISAGVWARQRYVREGSALLVLASEPYDPDSYHDEA